MSSQPAGTSVTSFRRCFTAEHTELKSSDSQKSQKRGSRLDATPTLVIHVLYADLVSEECLKKSVKILCLRLSPGTETLRTQLNPYKLTFVD